MPKSSPDKQDVLDAIKRAAEALGHSPSLKEFKSQSGLSEYQVTNHFINWREAVRAAGFEPHTANMKLESDALLEDWGQVVRKQRRIPTTILYRHEGRYDLKSFEKRFGPWAAVPDKFREFALNKSEWVDVIALLPQVVVDRTLGAESQAVEVQPKSGANAYGVDRRHVKLDDRSTYGNPIDFRGLRHEPVNEQGVVFLFGMIAREMGFMVEAVQTGYPDCEAKRQVGAGKWQRVRIEFEFESRNFDHPPDGCDVIICWRHNWPDCPKHLEVIELWREIKSLAKSDD
jgi:hypothetical protein